jgi:hypothetical protein
MTEAFWWYVLAGFLLGFGVSTLWEWLYFRRRRMTIRNQRIAELEATVRTYAAATGAPPSRVADEEWAEPIFQNPGVYLETEEPAPPAAPPDTLPPNAPQPAENVPPLRPAAFVSAAANGAPVPVRQPAPYPDYAGSTAPVGGFQSVAVQQPPATGSTASAAVAYSASSPTAGAGLPLAAQPAPSAEALATLGVVTVAHRLHEESREDVGESIGERVGDDAGDETADRTSATTGGETASVAAGDAAPAAGANRASQPGTGSAASADPPPPPPATTVVVERPPQTAYVNGRVDKPDAAGESSRSAGEANAPAGGAEGKEIRIITSSKIGAMRSEINSLLDDVDHTTDASMTATAESAPQNIMTDDPYTTRISTRTEYVLVRLVQSLVYFARQVRGILTGTDAARPALHNAPVAAGDDLTRIAGLNADHAARLNTAGVTSYARLVQLSPDELRQIAFTPGGAAVDPAGWRQAAAQLAASEGRRP